MNAVNIESVWQHFRGCRWTAIPVHPVRPREVEPADWSRGSELLQGWEGRLYRWNQVYRCFILVFSVTVLAISVGYRTYSYSKTAIPKDFRQHLRQVATGNRAPMVTLILALTLGNRMSEWPSSEQRGSWYILGNRSVMVYWNLWNSGCIPFLSTVMVASELLHWGHSPV